MSAPITWNHGVDHFDGNPTATVALDRARWEALGATFVEVDDGDDETPGLAVGEVDGLGFGVLDYGEGETFLLVGGEVAAGPVTDRLLTALRHAGALEADRDVVDVARVRRPDPTDELRERLAAMEHRLTRLESERRADLIPSFAFPVILREWLRQERWSCEEAGQLTLVDITTERHELLRHMSALTVSGLWGRRLLEPAAAPPAAGDDD